MTSIELQQILNCLDIIVSILEPVRDEKGRIFDFKYIYSNWAIEKMLSVAPAQLQGVSFLKIFRVSEELFGRIINVVEKETSFSENIYNADYSKWFKVSFKKYNDNLLAEIEDITAEKQSEETLKTNEKLFSTLFNNSGVGIVLMDFDGKVIKANAKICEMFGYEKDEAIGLDRGEVYPTNKTENGWELFNRLMNKEISSYEIEKQYKRKDGSFFWALLTMSLFDNNNEEGRPQAIAVIQDIDPRKKAEDSVNKLNKDLVELNNYKDRVVSVIAHDLRSPFATSKSLLDNIIGMIDIARKEDISVLLQMLNKKFTHIHNLLEELIVWAKNQLNKMAFEPIKVDVEKELQKVILTCIEQANEKQIEIVLNQTNATTVTADVNMLDAIVRNLLNNAIKFSPENSEILVKAESQAEGTSVSITDAGTGMTEETIRDIEAGRNQFVSYGTKGEKGLGLGLSLAKEFVEKNGGKLKIESRMNSGTTVSFTLPA